MKAKNKAVNVTRTSGCSIQKDLEKREDIGDVQTKRTASVDLSNMDQKVPVRDMAGSGGRTLVGLRDKCIFSEQKNLFN